MRELTPDELANVMGGEGNACDRASAELFSVSSVEGLIALGLASSPATTPLAGLLGWAAGITGLAASVANLLSVLGFCDSSSNLATNESSDQETNNSCESSESNACG